MILERIVSRFRNGPTLFSPPESVRTKMALVAARYSNKVVTVVEDAPASSQSFVTGKVKCVCVWQFNAWRIALRLDPLFRLRL